MVEFEKGERGERNKRKRETKRNHSEKGIIGTKEAPSLLDLLGTDSIAFSSRAILDIGIHKGCCDGSIRALKGIAARLYRAAARERGREARRKRENIT